MQYLINFARFWYDFIVGDDWMVALGVIIAVVATIVLAQSDLAAWWLMPLAVAGLLTFTVHRAAH